MYQRNKSQLRGKNEFQSGTLRNKNIGFEHFLNKTEYLNITNNV